MDKHISGWIPESDLAAFLDSDVSLGDICMSLTKIKDPQILDSIVRLLENVTRFKSLSVRLLRPEFLPFLTEAVKSPSERLRVLVVQTFSFAELADLLNSWELVMSVFRDEDTGVSERMGKILLGVYSKSGVSSGLPEKLLQYYGCHSEMNEVDQFRFLWLLVEMGKLNPDSFDLFRSSFDSVTKSFLESDDVLLKLSSLGLIEGLASFDAGRRYLAASNLLPALANELSHPDVDSTTVISLVLTLAGVVSVMGDDSHQSVWSVLDSPSSPFQNIITRFAISPLSAERMCAFKAIATLATGADTSRVIKGFLDRNWRTMQEIQRAMVDTDVEVINTAIDTVFMIVKHWERNPFMESASSQESLVNTILTTFNRHPFTDCRCLVYALVSVMVTKEELTESAFGQLFSSTSSVRKSIVDFQIGEANFEARKAKWNLVKAIMESAERTDLQRFLSREEIQNLTSLAENGPTWNPPHDKGAEMATEAM
jgi:hypothetical protein